MRDAQAVLRNARRALRTATGRRRGRLHRAINDLDTLLQRTERVVAQTRSRLAGVMPDSATRMVSFHDVDARPIRKGRLGKPVEFGYKAQVVDNADGVILDHTVEVGNPADAPQLVPAIARITERAGHAPTAVTADRGYGYASVETDLHDLGVRRVAIPRASKPGTARRSLNTEKRSAPRSNGGTGCEGRINHLKRSYGWNRNSFSSSTMSDSPSHPGTWCEPSFLCCSNWAFTLSTDWRVELATRIAALNLSLKIMNSTWSNWWKFTYRSASISGLSSAVSQGRETEITVPGAGRLTIQTLARRWPKQPAAHRFDGNGNAVHRYGELEAEAF